MESLKPDKPTFKTTTYPVSVQKNRSTVSAVRTENSILEMPKLVPVSDPKPPMESPQQQQSVLKKSVTTSLTPGAAGGAQNVIKLIKTVHGPNGNPINKIVSLKITGSSPSTSQSAVPLSLVPITLHKETQPAMLQISGVAPVPFRKIVPKNIATNQTTTKTNVSKELSHNLKLTKDVIMTTKVPSKPHAVLVKHPSQEPPMTKTQPKEPFAGFHLPSNITCSLPTGTSEVISTLVSSKTLEIKTISLMDSSKPTTTSSATAPITTATGSTNANTINCDLVVIEKKTPEKMPMPNSDLIYKDNGNGAVFKHPTGANKMINLQISNGKLSDPNGPIKLISGTKASKPETRSIESTTKESVLVDREEIAENTKVQPIDLDPLSVNLETLQQSANTSGNFSETSMLSPSDEKIPDDEPVTHRKPVGQKQQSLLRNKTIDLLQRSPRTKGRSKSLTALHNRFIRKIRRLSVSSEGDVKKAHTRKSSSITPPSRTPSEVQVTKLLCPEKMSASSDSLASSPPVLEKVTSNPTKNTSIEIIVMNSSDDESKDIEEVKSISPEPAKVTDNEIHSYLNWEDGIGFLKESNLQFHLNEFGLIEIIKAEQLKTETDPSKEKPIFEREFKSQKTLDYKNPYFCKGCNCKGASVDFLTSDFCSTECFNRFNGRKSNATVSLAALKKYTNRKRRIDEPEIDPTVIKPVQRKPSNVFQWESHLAACKGEPTPIDLFLNPFPCSSNMFSVGMKLEAIDPEHSSLFCVCTIVEKKGYRLKLHFDGYSKFYDFWVNADSMDIFPPGWCAKTNRTLQPPMGISALTFNWPKYLTQTKALPAPRNLFTHLNISSRKHGFKVGMKIEADDLRNSGKVCVATVADILDNRLLIVFDGWDDSYSYWIDVSSPFIHPVNWHKKHGFSIVPPPDYEDGFTWSSYLAHTKSIPATENLFGTRDPIDFKPGMKLEVVDKRNPSLIRPASVIMIDDYEIKVLFENWPAQYAFWMEDDSPDLHPIGWCEITNHELEPPPGFESSPSRYCKFPGCRGIGNALHPELNVHANFMSCPYAPANWSMDVDKSGRLRSCKKYNNSLLSADIKPKEIIQRNKRKADPLMREPVIAKLVKPQIEAQMQHSLLPISSAPVTAATSGVSLLANKLEKSDTNIDTRINIARHLLCDYGPRLQQVYSLWKQNSECLAVNLSENNEYKKNPLEWNVNEVAEYVAKLPRCQTIAPEFEKQDIDGTAFLAMRQSDLTEVMKIKLGPAIKIYNQIIQLREDVATRFKNNTSRIC